MPFDIIHIFTSEGLYQNKFIRFVADNCNISKNLFVFRQNKISEVNKDGEEEIIYIGNVFKFILVLLPKLIKCKKIIIHYLPIGPSLFLWYIFGFLLKKTTWVLWGSDLYFYKDRENNLLNNTYELLRKKIIKIVPHIACFIRGDYELAKRIYGTKADYTYICYPLPTDFNLLDNLRTTYVPDSKVKILVGNSAANTNNHIDVFNKLFSFRHMNIEVICPLSYGDEELYTQEVINSGNTIFGSKFIPLLKLIPPDKYSELLLTIDIVFMNHERQQGLGNILSLLFLGKKVYLRSDTTSYQFLTSRGIKIFSIEELEKNDFKSLTEFKEEYKIKNYHIINNEFSLENYKRMWAPIFKLD